jgi:hypothetical protein
MCVSYNELVIPTGLRVPLGGERPTGWEALAYNVCIMGRPGNN